MRILLFLAAITSCVLPGYAVTVEQRIAAVTVYPDGALVTRSGTVTIPAGVQTVVFDHLPMSLEEDSVRTKATSRTSMKVLGIEMRRDYREVAPTAEMKKLQDGLTKLGDQMRALTDEQRQLNMENDFLTQIRNRVTSPSSLQADNKEGSAQNIEALFTMYSQHTSKNTNRVRDIDFILRDLNRQNQDMTNRLALLQQPAQPNTRSALVTIDAGSGGSVDLSVTYMMAGAGWRPEYDAYADADTRKVDLTYYGVVRQTTGEDWDGVALTLSSSRPHTAARLPELQPWTIDLAGQISDASEKEESSLDQLKKVNSSAQATATAPGSNVSAFTGFASPVLGPVPMQNAQIQSLGPAATFQVPARTTIPSDDQPHRNAICLQTLKGDWTYEASPKLANGVFLKTRVTNTSGGPLLGGEINVFLGNNFIGKSNIGLVANDASFDLFLGADDNVKIMRTEGLGKEGVGGLLTRQRIYERSYAIEVENFKSTAIDLKLHDQIPVSKNGGVVVGVDKIEPLVESQNADTGELTWELKINPRQKKKFTVRYEVSAPYDKPIAGL